MRSHEAGPGQSPWSPGQTRISDVVDTAATHNRTLTDLQCQVKILMALSDDTENRLRQNNMQVVGLPEGAEGDNPATFAESLFKQVLNLQRVSSAYQVERVHRVPNGVRIPGAPARSFLVRFLNLWDRDLILAEVRRQQTIRYDNAVLHFFPDFSLELQKRRRSFVEVRKKLREKGLQYSM